MPARGGALNVRLLLFVRVSEVVDVLAVVGEKVVVLELLDGETGRPVN